MEKRVTLLRIVLRRTTLTIHLFLQSVQQKRGGFNTHSASLRQQVKIESEFSIITLIKVITDEELIITDVLLDTDAEVNVIF